MNQDMIREIATYIVEDRLLHNWWVYLVILCISFISAAGSAFIMPYLNARGKSLATKSDFQQILTQLEETTKTAEKIRAEIMHTDWASKEWKTIRRVKLEELLNCVYETKEWLEQKKGQVYGKSNPESISPIEKTETICRLYFPELENEVSAFIQECRQLNLKIVTAIANLYGVKDEVKLEIVREFTLSYKEQYQAILLAQRALEMKAPIVMREIMCA